MFTNDSFISTPRCGESSYSQRQPCRYPQWPHKGVNATDLSVDGHLVVFPEYEATPHTLPHTWKAVRRRFLMASQVLMRWRLPMAPLRCSMASVPQGCPVIPWPLSFCVIPFGMWDQDLGALTIGCSFFSICVSSTNCLNLKVASRSWPAKSIQL